MNKIEQAAVRLCKKYDIPDWGVELLNYVMLPKALRPKSSYIIGKLGITDGMYYSWLRNKRFNLARREFIKQYYQDDIPDVIMAMKDEALAGNERAARLFLEYVDDWDKDPLNIDPDNPNNIKPINELKIVINQLQQKFYGSNNEEIKTIETTSEPIIEA